MPSHLDTLRHVYLAADAVPALFPPVDDDLSREAGMNGYLARLLQAARDLDTTETPTPAPAPKYRLRCTFIPQAWVNNYAVTVDPEGPTSWDTDWFGAVLPAPNSYESDQLRDGADAPTWAKDWSGPYEVEYEVIPSAAKPPTPAPTAHATGHKPTPWRVDDCVVVTDWTGQGAVTDEVVADIDYCIGEDEEAKATAARIVACVNACAGIDNPAAAIAAARAVLKDLVQSYGESAFGAWRALELLGEK